MLVGKIDIDEKKLAVSSRSVETFLEFSDSLVPKAFNGCKAIIDNQRYLCCVKLRKIESVSWSVKKPLLDEVMSGLSIIGYMDELVEVEKLCSIVNMYKVHEYIERSGK